MQSLRPDPTVTRMARPKAKTTPGGKPGPKPDPAKTRGAMTLVRSSEAWKSAVAEFAEFDRCTSVSELIDRAVVAYARERGYGMAIPKR